MDSWDIMTIPITGQIVLFECLSNIMCQKSGLNAWILPQVIIFYVIATLDTLFNQDNDFTEKYFNTNNLIYRCKLLQNNNLSQWWNMQKYEKWVPMCMQRAI